jgi:hypothetical protein
MTLLRFRFLAPALVAGLLTLGALDARAQTQIDDTKLEAFVVAALAVDRKIEEWQGKISAAGSDEQAAQMREQANADILDTIEQSNGITLTEYQEIRQVVAQDPAMLDRVTDIMREKNGQ